MNLKALILLPLALSACAMARPVSAPLVGSEWRFNQIDGAEPVRKNARLTFHPDRLSANVGCNGMGGEWRINKGRLIAGPFMSTQMWCEGVMDQERALGTLLASNPVLTVKGKAMTLKGEGHSALLTRTN